MAEHLIGGNVINSENPLSVELTAALTEALTEAQNLQPNGTQVDQALAVDATAGGVQFAAFHADTTHVRLQVQTADVRVTFDGSAPTAANGELLPVGYTDIWRKELASAAKFICTGATSAVAFASQLKG